MRPRSKGLVVLTLLLLARAAAADPSDMAGRWALIVDDPAAGEAAPRVPATAGSGWGREITITRDDGRITIERHQFVEQDAQPPMRYVYVLGGGDSRNVVDMGRGPQEQVARASFQGGTLVIVSRHADGTDLAAEVTQAFSIDGSGTLVVEVTRTAGGATSTTKARYRRLR
jgi:hypothetical protein